MEYLARLAPAPLKKVFLLTTGSEATECAVKLARTHGQKGGGASFAPPAYIQALAGWCRDHRALLIFDEIQAGFGRTGKLFGFEHYGVVPDLFCCGKGISSSLPLSAVIGRPDVLDLYGPAEMTSTHTGNPVCAAAALASVRKVVEGGLIENARVMGEILLSGLKWRRPSRRACSSSPRSGSAGAR